MPNDNYCKFEDWLMPILERMVDEQDTQVRAGHLGVGLGGPWTLGVVFRGSLDSWAPPGQGS